MHSQKHNRQEIIKHERLLTRRKACSNERTVVKVIKKLEIQIKFPCCITKLLVFQLYLHRMAFIWLQQDGCPAYNMGSANKDFLIK